MKNMFKSAAFTQIYLANALRFGEMTSCNWLINMINENGSIYDKKIQIKTLRFNIFCFYFVFPSFEVIFGSISLISREFSITSLSFVFLGLDSFLVLVWVNGLLDRCGVGELSASSVRTPVRVIKVLRVLSCSIGSESQVDPESEAWSDNHSPRDDNIHGPGCED